jgi:DnaJ-class molecular chaperone
MRSQTIDPYQVLGIKKDASEAEIKEAYKQKVKEHHPDVGGNEEECKNLNIAYETLSDPQKKAEYDSPGSQFNGIDLNDIISQMMGKRGGFFSFGDMGNPNAFFNQTLQQSFDIDVFTLILGGEGIVRLPNGAEKKITIPPNTPANARFQLKLDRNLTLILVPHVTISKLTEEQLKKLGEVFKL